MGRRYSDILRGAQLAKDLENYTTYLTTPRDRNVGTGGDRAPQRQLFLTPFGQDIETDELVQVQGSQAGYTALSTYIVAGNGAEVATALGANTVATVPNFRPARIVWFRNATKTKTVVRSKVTNRQYLKYAGDRDSCPFGRATATDDQIDVFNSIKADILANNNTLEVNRVSLTREKISF